MKIHFLVIGGGVGGLCTALALCRAGHRVTVLEVEDFFEKTWGTTGGCAVTPNTYKLLTRWGMGAQVDKLASHTKAISLIRLETGDTLGVHLLNEELLRDSGGDFCYVDYTELRRILREAAIGQGATMRPSEPIRSIAAEEDSRPSVTLHSGEVLEADVIVAADGPESVARRVVLEEDVQDISMKLTICRIVLSKDQMRQEPKFESLLEKGQCKFTTFAWCGNGRAAVAFCSGAKQDTFSLQVYVPEQGTEDWWNKDVSSAQLLEALGPCNIQLQKMIELSKTAKGFPVARPAKLENWVHPTGRLLLIGDTAHAFPEGSLHSISPNVEDAATLGELFSHLHYDQQIDQFLVTFEELRRGRVEEVLNIELGRLTLLTMPTDQLERNHAKGLDAFANEDGDLLDSWEVDKSVFAYDAEEHAADWWNDWGLLEERAREVQIPSSLDSLRVHVDCHSQDVLAGH